MDWISVKDKLPPTGLVVLCVFKSGNYRSIEMGRLLNDKSGWDIGQIYLIFNAITHWMPLPQLP